MNKNLKKLSAITLAATMMLGSTVTVLATDTSSSGTGTYEGGEMKYPAISVTLPTIPAGTYDYIADPNGLIAATSNEKYSDATFTGTTGIFFLTDTNKYTENSATFKAINESAVAVDITVKLEEEAAGDTSIKYAESSTFTGTDNELYLALTDGTTTKAIKSATEAAVITTEVAGVPGNYEAKYDSGSDSYGYALKSSGLTDWEECSFNLTGALNTSATWGDGLTFPTIKVTWSYAEHVDGPTVSANSIANNGGTVDITLPEGVTISECQKLKSDGETYNTLPTTYYTVTDIENGVQLKLGNLLGQYSAATSIKIVFSDDSEIILSVTQ